MKYEPTPESVRQHRVPQWFHDAKLGIFIHWGLYSVPAWAPPTGELGKVIAEEGATRWFAENPYAEWYYNTIRIEDSPSQRHHLETYGPDFAGQPLATSSPRDVWPRLCLPGLCSDVQPGHTKVGPR